MSKTPKRNSLASITPGFSRIKLPESPASSPQKNLTGPPRVARDIVADVYNNLQLWNGHHIAGAQVVKQIAVNKSNNYHKYNPELEELVNNLYGIVQKMSKCKDAFELYSQQIKSLSLLQSQVKPLFISMKIDEMSSSIDEIREAYRKEFYMKEDILENIAHAKTTEEAMFLATAWMYQCSVPKSIGMKLEALLLETGHKKIT